MTTAEGDDQIDDILQCPSQERSQPQSLFDDALGVERCIRRPAMIPSSPQSPGRQNCVGLLRASIESFEELAMWLSLAAATNPTRRFPRKARKPRAECHLSWKAGTGLRTRDATSRRLSRWRLGNVRWWEGTRSCTDLTRHPTAVVQAEFRSVGESLGDVLLGCWNRSKG